MHAAASVELLCVIDFCLLWMAVLSDVYSSAESCLECRWKLCVTHCSSLYVVLNNA